MLDKVFWFVSYFSLVRKDSFTSMRLFKRSPIFYLIVLATFKKLFLAESFVKITNSSLNSLNLFLSNSFSVSNEVIFFSYCTSTVFLTRSYRPFVDCSTVLSLSSMNVFSCKSLVTFPKYSASMMFWTFL